jgi:hypothetical protein
VKYRVTMKDPDQLHDSIREAAEADLKEKFAGLDDDEFEAVLDKREEKLSEQASQWFEYGEYLVVEIDTESNTCTVVGVGK